MSAAKVTVTVVIDLSTLSDELCSSSQLGQEKKIEKKFVLRFNLFQRNNGAYIQADNACIRDGGGGSAKMS